MKDKILKFLSSYELSIHLLLVACVYYVFLFVWGITSLPLAVRNISITMPFIVLYMVFFINLTLCLINRIPVVIKKCSSSQRFIKDSTSLLTVKLKNAESVSGILRGLIKKGYRRVEMPGETEVYLLKGRWSASGEILFHMFFFFIITGIFLSAIMRFEGRANVVEGFSFWGEKEEYFSGPEEKAFFKKAPDASFRLDEAGAEFWGNKLFFTDLYATVRYPGDTLKKVKTVRLKSGIRIGLTHFNIEGFGYAPVYLLKDNDGKIKSSMTVNLNVFPPPTEDSFLIPQTPYRVYVRFYPDAVLDNGKLRTETLNLYNPLYSVRVLRGKRILFSGNIKPDEEITIDNCLFSFTEIKKWAQFRIIRDPGIPFIWTGITLCILGLFWRVFLYRKELYLRAEDNDLIISAESEWFREIHRKQIGETIERLTGRKQAVNLNNE